MNTKKDKNAVFILQITESAVKLLWSSSGDNHQKKRNCGIEVEFPGENASDDVVAGAVSRLFKKSGYADNRLVVALPRNKATVRYLKVPARASEEIEKMLALQASRLVPYPQEELITGYQIIGTDSDGFTELNLIIVHKDILERYFALCKGIPRPSLNVVLSSYGLSGLYAYLRPVDTGTVMLLDFDGSQIELAVSGGKKLLFSRSVKMEREAAAWEKSLLEEIKRTMDACIDETAGRKPEKIIVFGTAGRQAEEFRILKEKAGFPVENLSFEKELNFSAEALKASVQTSCAALAGLSLNSIPVSLSLLPQQLKERTARSAQAKQAVRLALFVFASIVLAGAGLFKSLDNKQHYLSLLEQELKKNEKEAAYLADLEYRLRAFEERLQVRPSVLEMLYQLFQVTPASVSITQFSFEEDTGAVLRGQCSDFNSVLELVSLLNKSPAYAKNKVKVRFASRKKTAQGEIVDFEIGCTNR